MTRNTTTKTPRAKAEAAAAEPAATAAAPAKPLLDIRALLDKLKLPDVDVPALLDSRRRDVEALLAANEQAYRGFEAVARRQGEMLSEAMKGLSANAKDTLAAKGTTERVQKVADHAQQAFGKALADMKEIAELSAKSQQQVIETLNTRLRDSIGEIGERLRGKAA